jgi:Fic family protein
MEAMCRFANAATSPADGFIHPVARAILLHFWFAYDHPFVDGNGRTARALFYWSMLRSGYWLCEYVSISHILKKAPAKYGCAFLETETDENDATYFILHQLNVITRAIRALHVHLATKAEEIRQVESLFRTNIQFNYRQLAVLSHGLRHADARYTIRSHQRSHNVVYETARSDLHDLVERGLLTSRKHGRTYYFHPADDLPRRLSRA